MAGKLYIVATPIGNLADISYRAVETLRKVDIIAAEDTRHVKTLLQHYAIQNHIISLHQINEQKIAAGLITQIQQDQSIALVSDAGTPLISDPGLPLVQLAQQENIEISPIPGACALITALSVAGLPVSRFIFEGFIPRASAAKKKFFQARLNEKSTWAFYESCHRIAQTLQDMLAVFPADHSIVIARELTKLHETVVKDTLSNITTLVDNDDNMRKGEFVVIVDGMKEQPNQGEISEEEQRILKILLAECSTKQAASIAAEITGQRKKLLYQAALQINYAG